MPRIELVTRIPAPREWVFDLETDDPGTRMIDVFDFASPLGPLGKVVDMLVLARARPAPAAALTRGPWGPGARRREVPTRG